MPCPVSFEYFKTFHRLHAVPPQWTKGWISYQFTFWRGCHEPPAATERGCVTGDCRHDPRWGPLCHFLPASWYSSERKHHGCCQLPLLPQRRAKIFLVICRGKKRRNNPNPPDPCGIAGAAAVARGAAPPAVPCPRCRPALPLLSPQPRCHPPGDQRARRRKAVFSKPDYAAKLT